MKSGLLPLLFLSILQVAQAGLEWREFGDVRQSPARFRLGDVAIRVIAREVDNTAFKEDHLALESSRKGSPPQSHWFTSSYGTGAVAIEGGLLFLKYGTGRGTFAREEHVRVMRLNGSGGLEEMADVKVSTYVSPPSSNSPDPVSVEYAVQTRKDPSGTTITFIPPVIPGMWFPRKTLTIEAPASPGKPGGPRPRE